MTTSGDGPTVIHGVPVSWDGVRDLFMIDPAVAYFNHGGFGAVPIPVMRAQQRLREEVEANPMAFYTRGLMERLGHVRRHVAAFLGADPEGTAFVANATAGVAVVLGSVPLAPGDEILVTDHGYQAVTAAARHRAARTGATVRVVPIPLAAADDEVVARIAEAARPGRTRLAIVDQVSSPTAKLLPVARVCSALRELGVAVLVDAAHAPGMLPVDVSAIGADFWVANLHKWAFAPRPTAVLVVAASQRDRIEPLVIAGRHANGFPEAVDYRGTLDYTGPLAVPAGLHLMRTLGVDAIRRHNVELAGYAQRAAAVALHIDPAELVGSAPVSMRLIPAPPGLADSTEDAAALRSRLATEYRCEVAVNAWGGRSYVRISAQVYNTEAEVDRLADALGHLGGARRRSAA